MRVLPEPTIVGRVMTVRYMRTADGKTAHLIGCPALGKASKPYPWRWASELDLAAVIDACGEMGIKVCRVCIGKEVERA